MTVLRSRGKLELASKSDRISRLILKDQDCKPHLRIRTLALSSTTLSQPISIPPEMLGKKLKKIRESKNLTKFSEGKLNREQILGHNHSNTVRIQHARLFRFIQVAKNKKALRKLLQKNNRHKLLQDFLKKQNCEKIARRH